MNTSSILIYSALMLIKIGESAQCMDTQCVLTNKG